MTRISHIGCSAMFLYYFIWQNFRTKSKQVHQKLSKSCKFNSGRTSPSILNIMWSKFLCLSGAQDGTWKFVKGVRSIFDLLFVRALFAVHRHPKKNVLNISEKMCWVISTSTSYLRHLLEVKVVTVITVNKTFIQQKL